MLQAVQLPAGVTDLDTSLTNVDRNTFTLEREKGKRELFKHDGVKLRAEIPIS